MKIRGLILLALSLSGCAVQYGNKIETTLVKSDPEILEPNKGHVDIFFEEVPCGHLTRQIGMVEAKGGKHDGETDILNRLKWQAWKAGADGVIHVRKASQNRETGTLFADDKEVYDASLYTGVAVKYLDALPFVEKVDSTLVRDVPAQLNAEIEEVGTEFGISIFLGMIVGVALLINLSTSK